MAPTVTSRVAINGADTLLVVDGAGPGRHEGNVRLWPHGQEIGLAWSDDCHRVTVLGLHDRGVATVDGGDEIRFDVGEMDPDAEGEEPATEATPTLTPTVESDGLPAGAEVELEGQTGDVVDETGTDEPQPIKADAEIDGDGERG